MKKLLVAIVLSCLFLSVISAANAQDVWFHTYVSCTDTTTYFDVNDGYTYKVFTCDDNTIYVYHFDDVNTDEYTNHFRGRKSATGTSFSNVGSKWCTQYLKVPIQSSSIVVNQYYRVSARGNTNYYNYDGIKSVLLNGRYDPNYGYSGTEDMQ